MAIGLYMDVHIPRAITNGLRLRGVDVLTAQEDETITLPDSALLDRATELRQTALFARRRFAGRSAQSFDGKYRIFRRRLFSSIEKSDWKMYRRFGNNRQIF